MKGRWISCEVILFLFSDTVIVPKSAAYSMESILTVPALETNAPSVFSTEGSG